MSQSHVETMGRCFFGRKREPKTIDRARQMEPTFVGARLAATLPADLDSDRNVPHPLATHPSCLRQPALDRGDYWCRSHPSGVPRHSRNSGHNCAKVVPIPRKPRIYGVFPGGNHSFADESAILLRAHPHDACKAAAGFRSCGSAPLGWPKDPENGKRCCSSPRKTAGNLAAGGRHGCRSPSSPEAILIGSSGRRIGHESVAPSNCCR